MSALERGPPDGREGAAWTASSLAADPANIGAFVQADAVPRLLQMLKTGARLRARGDLTISFSCPVLSTPVSQPWPGGVSGPHQCCWPVPSESPATRTILQVAKCTVCEQCGSDEAHIPEPPSEEVQCRCAGKTLGRDSALHVLACVARGGGGDSVAMIGGAGLEVLSLSPEPSCHVLFPWKEPHIVDMVGTAACCLVWQGTVDLRTVSCVSKSSSLRI